MFQFLLSLKKKIHPVVKQLSFFMRVAQTDASSIWNSTMPPAVILTAQSIQRHPREIFWHSGKSKKLLQSLLCAQRDFFPPNNWHFS